MTQKEALEILKLGHNVYLTGAAGSGKTHVLRTYIEHLKKHHVNIAITATTGIAATHLGGVTIDGWSGIGIRDTLTREDVEHIKEKLHIKLRYFSTKVLIIDEISMLHAHKLDLLDYVSRTVRGINLPFGGMQIVLCGDFFQLPPVSHDRNSGDFIYKSRIWHAMDLRVCYLEKPHRQEEGPYLQILSAIRQNKVDDTIIQLLSTTLGQKLPTSFTPTRLYTHNIDVDAINQEQLSLLQEPEHTYKLESKGNPHLGEILTKNCLAPQILTLKKNSIVMFVKNNPKAGYVNGTLGKIVGFSSDNYPIVETTDKQKITVYPIDWTIEENNMVKARITQIPLRLAWAITIHKSQGMSLDAAEIDLSKSFLPGMGYVALSRVRSLAGVKLIDINKMALEVNPEVVLVDKQLQELSKKEEYKLKRLSWLAKVFKRRSFMNTITSSYTGR